MKIETIDTHPTTGAKARPFVSAATQPSSSSRAGWVICVTDAGTLGPDADQAAAAKAAQVANSAFLDSCEAYEELPPDKRLEHALVAANEQLGTWWKAQHEQPQGVALTAVALGAQGAHYIAVGDGTIAVFDDNDATIVRRGVQERTGDGGPRAGLYGHPLSPDRAERGRYPVPPNPKGIVVIGTGLLGYLDDEALHWTAIIGRKPRQLVRALVDAVADQTRQRRPGVHVTAAADW